MVDLDDPVVRANALAQTHPFGEAAYRYVRAMVAQERLAQPVEDLGVWAGHALTAGYCLRRVEEDRAGRRLDTLPGGLPEDLDDAVRHVAGLIRTEGAEPYLLADEAAVVDLLDRMIGSEIQRRVGHWREQLTDDSYEELVEYLAWWVIKGYALRTIEVLDPPPAEWVS
ncbi:hypothetical protein BH23ACT9_BH23ACT9_31870 [soil metagenome]